MQAIILAAGMGRRLRELTQNNTKCMVEVNGVSLIERLLRQLDKQNLSRVVIVVGYKGKELIDYISMLSIKTPISFVNNPIYDKTNNIYSLSLARDKLCEDDTLLFESDLIVDDDVIKVIIEDPRDTLALVDKRESWMDGTCVKLNDNDEIVEFVSGKEVNCEDSDEYYKTVNIYKFSREFSHTHYIPFLDAYQSALGQNEYYEQVLKVIALIDAPIIKAKRLTNQRWYEIDDIQDLDIAESIFCEDAEDRTDMIFSRYGGYWRYPNLLDFCYLVNPYYPSTAMKSEIKANFDMLLTQYPSGMKVNSLLAARNFGVQQKNIVVGNGAAELIKSLMSILQGSTGFIRPTFEEYPNRYSEQESIAFIPQNRDFSYSADDVMTYFQDKDINNLVIVNPDNPSGNYINHADIYRLVNWCKDRELRLVLDESFVDFADEREASMIVQETLDNNPHLYVMKSISKSYGVPGLRLGVLASGDVETIDYIKRDVAIWNINSLGEYYMQIEEKYRSDYKESLVKLREERRRFTCKLNEIRGVRTIGSQANYIMVEIESEVLTRELLKKLLIKHDILIKDLNPKTGGNYIRIAVRNTEDNDRLVFALSKELGQ